MKVISRIRIHKKTGQRTVTVPKQIETENWKTGELVEIKKLEIK